MPLWVGAFTSDGRLTRSEIFSFQELSLAPTAAASSRPLSFPIRHRNAQFPDSSGTDAGRVNFALAVDLDNLSGDELRDGTGKPARNLPASAARLYAAPWT
jgi:hypothetical protein